MPTRADVVAKALSQNGYHDGQGYDERCVYSQYFLGPSYGAYGEGGTGPNDTPVEAYCFIFASWVYKTLGIPLPQMGAQAIASGGQYVPQGFLYATQHNAIIPSYLASPGDLCMFQWDGLPFSYDWSVEDGKSHVEIVERWSAGVLYTVGGNSGPSNVDGFKGDGGVHRHAWSCPAGVGNELIAGVVNTSKFVTFSTSPTPEPPVPVAMPALPVIDPGKDVGHPKMVTLIKTVMELANPAIDVSTPAKLTAAVKQWQMVLFNGWQTPPHGPRPQAVTGVVDPATFAGILRAAGVQ